MVRKGRNRSQSTGSYTDVTTTPPNPSSSSTTTTPNNQTPSSTTTSPSSHADTLFHIAQHTLPPSLPPSSSTTTLLSSYLYHLHLLSHHSPIPHTRRLLLSSSDDGGYTPLHSAVYHRNLERLLLYLRVAAADGDDVTTTTSEGDVRQKSHPMVMMEGMPSLSLGGDTGNQLSSSLLNDVISARDNEGLTPVELICRMSEGDLRRCRESLMNGRRSVVLDEEEDGEDDDDEEEEVGESLLLRSRQRRRVRRRRRRVRSGSFQSLDDDFEYERVYGGLNRDGGNEFDELRRGDEGWEDDNDDCMSGSVGKHDHGCEVLTFGRADHCALGIPHYSHSSHTKTHRSSRPRRVEAFGLGQQVFDDDDDDDNHCRSRSSAFGSAVVTSAAAHHTLVATRDGRLFAFGLGKGGRLGTGDENHRPLPTLITGPLSRRVVTSVAAALNHSLCTTSDGSVYAWGSNRFHQLGIGKNTATATTTSSSASAASSSNDYSFYCTPRRVDDLKKMFIVDVAAGDRHSVTLSHTGHVYTFGDNRSGQLGLLPLSSSPNHSSTPHPHRLAPPTNTSHHPAFAIAASEHSTLILTSHSPTNVIYTWGHGNHTPSRVIFTPGTVNPVGIATARFHNVAYTSEGDVYTWGYHSDPLGYQKTPNKKHNAKHFHPRKVPSLPQPAVGVAAAEGRTAVILADGTLYTWGCAAYGTKGVLGHEGATWVETPKKVTGVTRVVGVSLAREHTVLLVGTVIPVGMMPKAAGKGVGTLKDLAAVRVARHVDLCNVLTVSMMAKRIYCDWLKNYCREFVRLNVDGVLSLAKKSDLEMFLDDVLSDPLPSVERDGCIHPLIYELARLGGEEGSGEGWMVSHHRRGYNNVTSSSSMGVMRWMADCEAILRDLPLATKHMMPMMPTTTTTKIKKGSGVVLHTTTTASTTAPPTMINATTTTCGKTKTSTNAQGMEDDQSFNIITNGSEKYKRLSDESANIPNLTIARETHDTLAKELRGLKKKLSQIDELEKKIDSDSSTRDGVISEQQKNKLARKPILEANLTLIERAIVAVTDKLRVFEILDEKKRQDQSMALKQPTSLTSPYPKDDDSLSEKVFSLSSPSNVAKASSSITIYRCDICSITCPDSSSYALHVSGRKHRNNIRRREDKDTAATIIKMTTGGNKKVGDGSSSTLDNDKDDVEVVSCSSSSLLVPNRETSGGGICPKYRLPCPPQFSDVGTTSKTPGIAAAASKATDSQHVAHHWTIQPKPPKSVSSFQTILEEEEKQRAAQKAKLRTAVGGGGSLSGKKTGTTWPAKSPPKMVGTTTGASSPWSQIPASTLPSHQIQNKMLTSPPSKKQPPSSLTATPSPPKTATSTPQPAAWSKMPTPTTPLKSPEWNQQKKKTQMLSSPLTKKQASVPLTPISSQPKTTPSSSSLSPWSQTKQPSPSVLPLHAFLSPSKQPPAAAPTNPPPPPKTWSSPTTTPNKISTTTATTPHNNPSLNDIQKEEERIKANSHQTPPLLTGNNSTKQWYLERRERGDSFNEIQEQEEKKKNWRLFVEEQKEIEEQIQREREEIEKEEMRKKKKKKKREKRKQQRRSGNGGGGGRGGGSGGNRVEKVTVSSTVSAIPSS